MKKYFVICLLISACFIFPLFAQAETFPDFPMAFYGQATLNGSPMSTGSTIRAYYGADLGGEIKVQSNGIYGYQELNRQRLVVKNGNGLMTFKFIDLSGNEKEGSSPISYSAFSSGATIEKNLNFITTMATPVQSSGGSVSQSSVSTSPLSTVAQQADTNSDGKIDVLDFVTLMANWGKTGSSIVGDFNHDSKIDVLDFVMLMVYWTK